MIVAYLVIAELFLVYLENVPRFLDGFAFRRLACAVSLAATAMKLLVLGTLA